jgi:hypothetical protein
MIYTLLVSYGNPNMKTPVSRYNPPLTYTGTLVLTPAWFEIIGAAMPQTYETVLNNPLAVALTGAGKDSGVYAYYQAKSVSVLAKAQPPKRVPNLKRQ